MRNEKYVYENLFFSKINDFLKIFLLKQTGTSLYTEKAYRISLAAFYDYVTKVLHISPMKFEFMRCDYHLVLEYSQYMQSVLNYSRATVNLRLSAIRAYLEYVSAENFNVTPVFLSVKKVPMLAVPQIIRPIIEPSDLKIILNLPKKTKLGYRDRFILILLFDSAIRVSELVNIKIGDIIKVRQNYSIIIHGKGRKERCITLSDKASAHLDKYIQYYHRDLNNAQRPLFYSSIHGRMSQMSARNIERILHKYGILARENGGKIPVRIYPHMMRRTRATLLYRDGIPIEQISALLGHQHMETTRSHYASPSSEQIRDAVNKGASSELNETRQWLGHEDEIKKRFGLL